ncbi:MAG: N-6 DNA methylase, partial [Bdellovibrionaceae bacterium]|nr:N-6 DNA methylase [Pseudobdellovibrionaceae bacterium]
MVPQSVISWIENKTGRLNQKQTAVLGLCYNYFTIEPTSEISSKLFKKIHGEAKRKQLGITYTPERVRQELAQQVLNQLSKKFDYDEIKISDPCCGSGAFSISVLEELAHRGIKKEVALARNIYFSDIDPLSVGLAMMNIYFYFKRDGTDLIQKKIRINAHVQDFFQSRERFHAFITNPPYVKLQN